VTNTSSNELETAMRRGWETWAQMLRGAAEGAAQAMGGSPGSNTRPSTISPAFPWSESLGQWGRQINASATPPSVQELTTQFQRQAGDWLSTMQQVAVRFAGQDSNPGDIARAWREAVQAQGQGEQMLRWMLEAARGSQVLNDMPWLRELSHAVQSGFLGNQWLNVPTFGPAREHQARWQGLLKLQKQYQASAEAYTDSIRRVIDDAYKRFEEKLAAHEDPGEQLSSARALFDLWIDAAEEAYEKMALSEQFRDIYGTLANAQMRLRAATQQEMERACELMGIPLRSEMDTAHRRITELERQVQRLSALVYQEDAEQGPPDEAFTPRTRRKTTATETQLRKDSVKPAGKRTTTTSRRRSQP